MPGDFIPHVRMMDTGRQNTSLAGLFGLPYVVVRKPRPIDTTTLNYNWQIWDTSTFSLYTTETDFMMRNLPAGGVCGSSLPHPHGNPEIQQP